MEIIKGIVEIAKTVITAKTSFGLPDEYALPLWAWSAIAGFLVFAYNKLWKLLKSLIR